MHVDIIKQDGKLSLANLQCDCEYDHNIPDLDIYIKRGLADGCPDYAAKAGLGRHVLVVADQVTYDIAAERIAARLKGAGYSCKTCVLTGSSVEPTPENAEYILSAAAGADFLLGVGSGVITDLTRRAAVLSGLPFAVFGTAASMDAYTSVTSAMIIGGIKKTVYGKAARLLMFDPAVIASAPMDMQASGVGDMFAKYNVLVDWRLGHAVIGETYCPLCESLVTTALDTASSNIEDIAKRTEKGAEALIEALILGGFSILIVGDTRPVSSIEHNMAHFWDMSHIAYGTPHIPHGTGAGLGLVYALIFHDALKNADLSKLDKEIIKSRRISKEQQAARIKSYYPPGVGEEVMATNKYWYLEWPEQEKHIEKILGFFEEYRLQCESLPGYRDIIKTFELFGAPASAAKAGLGIDMLRKTLFAAKDFRPRYNVAKALDALGLFEQAAERILETEPTL
jgi:glycerol-1-phosphate dehydrogenase [NAD(P)+]